MSVLKNVALGAHMRGRAGLLRASLHLERDEEDARRTSMGRPQGAPVRRRRQPAAGQAAHRRDRPRTVFNLSPAAARRAAAGLRHLEKQALAELLGKLREEGMGVPPVEHDMDFVMGIADQVVVMEFGQKLAAGLPQQIQDDPGALAAYLGGVE